MIIADKKKAIFIHIEKTGGRSITKLLTPYISEQYRNKNINMPGWGQTWHINRQHAKFSESLPILDRLNIDPLEYFKFAIVRSPYSRLLSIWRNMYQSPMEVPQTLINKLRFQFSRYTGIRRIASQHFYHMYPDGSFKNFVLFIEHIATNHPPSSVKRYLGAMDQYSYIENNRGIEFNFIGKLENFNADIVAINNKLELTASSEIPHLNKDNKERNNKKYLEFYDEESIAIVNKIFVRDFETFDYPQLS